MDNLNIAHNTDEKQFEIIFDNGSVAKIEYQLAGKNIIYTHTEVPEAYEGQGIASKLAYHVMEYAKENHLKVQALCPFVKKYVDEHEEYHSITWGY